MGPLIDYGDIIYDQPQNESFCEKLESVQYKAALAITGAMQGTSCDKIYQELGLESLKARRWYKHLSCMFKIMKKLLIIWLTWFQNVKQSSEQEITIFRLTIVERTASSILFSLLI